MAGSESGRFRVTRVGLFGKVGAGNIGNDASMEAVVGFLRAEHPDAIIDAMCTGPETLRTKYGIDAIPMFWHTKFDASGPGSLLLKVTGRFLDTFRTGAWVARHDVVIVPGAGILEASLPMVPRGWPYALFLASGYGKLLGVKVAMVSVGAGAIRRPTTRWLMDSAARMASYRSFRDAGARAALGQRGINVAYDPVYPDLAFALKPPPAVPVDDRLVAVGVMDYHGNDHEHRHADEIYALYTDSMKRFVRWLTETGHRVLLVVGDTNGSDGTVVDEILADVRATLPELEPSAVTAASVSSYTDVMRALGPASSVVAIRYHNVLCALKLGKPTIAISYSPKHNALMANMGLGEFSHDVNALDVDELKRLFTLLEQRSRELRGTVAAHNAMKSELLAEQFRRLTAAIFPPRPGRGDDEREPARVAG